jgi:general stress protein 26
MMNDQMAEELINNLINSQNIAVVTTVGRKKMPHSTALAKIKNEGFQTLYFSTGLSTEKVQNILKRKVGAVYFYNALEYIGVSLEGYFSITTSEKINVTEDIFPPGIRNTSKIVLKFETKEAKLYSGMEKVTIKI